MVYKRVRGWTSGRSLQIPVLNFFKYPHPPLRGWASSPKSAPRSLGLLLQVSANFKFTCFCYFWLRYFCCIIFYLVYLYFLQKIVGGGEALSPSQPVPLRGPCTNNASSFGKESAFQWGKIQNSQMPLSLLYVLICSLHFLILKSILFCFVKIELKNSKGSM